MASRFLASAALVAIATFGYFSILGLGEKNGFFGALDDALAKSNDVDAAGIPLRRAYTGLLAPLDSFLNTLVAFFTPCVSRELPALTLFSAFAAVQVLPLHTAVVLEGLRSANAGTVFALAAVWGTIYQTVPFGIVLPIYCALYVWRSPLAYLSPSTPPASRAEMLSMDPLHVRAVTGALTLGYVVPTLLAALPAMFPGKIATEVQEVFLAVWQFFPAQVAAWQFILLAVVKKLGLVKESVQWHRATPEARLLYSGRVYRYILGITAALHLALLNFVVVPWMLSTSSESESAIDATGDLQAAFVPMSVLAPRRITSLAEGTLTLLQYDVYCAAGSVILLTSYLSYVAWGSVRAGGVALAKSIQRTLVVGPGGAVLWALWDRDDAALSAAAEVKKRS